MLFFIKDKKDCTGCSACLNICPVHCITMKQDEEGFDFPYANEECKHCNKCKEVCPIASGNIQVELKIKQYAVAAVSKDINIWKASTSGGAFTEICNIFGNKNTVIFGAAFDELRVVHSYVTGVKNISRFQRSKYVQSTIGCNYKKAKQFLEQGKKVIFSGTPCQIAGLRSYIGKEYENLFCVDFICHGVGSPKVFDKVLKYISEKYGAMIESYSFRAKRIIMGNLKLYVSRYAFANGKIKYIEKDEYNRLFLHQLCLRKSCGSNCKFRSSNRMSDITIADFKNKDTILRQIKDYRNYSTIIINSIKGDRVLKNLNGKMNIYVCNLEIVKDNNPLFYKKTDDNSYLRNKFFKDFTKDMCINDIIQKYVPVQNKRRLIYLRNWIPYKYKLWIKELITKIVERITNI